MVTTSQTARKLTTLLAQMQDEARAARIKGLRTETPGMTQPKIIGGLEELAGHHVVTLRGYQEWERTGALRYENAVLLARFYEIDINWLWSGDSSGETPNLVEKLSGNGRTEVDVEVLARLEKIEEKLDLLLRAVGQATGDQTESDEALDEVLAELGREPAAEEPGGATAG